MSGAGNSAGVAPPFQRRLATGLLFQTKIDELELEVWVLGSMHEIKERASLGVTLMRGRDGIQIEGADVRFTSA